MIEGTWEWALKQLEEGKKVRVVYPDDDPRSWRDNWTSYLVAEPHRLVGEGPAHYARRILLVKPEVRTQSERGLSISCAREDFWNPYLHDFKETNWVVVED